VFARLYASGIVTDFDTVVNDFWDEKGEIHFHPKALHVYFRR